MVEKQPNDKAAERPVVHVFTAADREQMLREEQVAIAKEVRENRLDEFKAGEHPAYTLADGKTKVGPNGRPLDADGREERPRAGELS
jgi:hypothetical protein